MTAGPHSSFKWNEKKIKKITDIFLGFNLHCLLNTGLEKQKHDKIQYWTGQKGKQKELIYFYAP